HALFEKGYDKQAQEFGRKTTKPMDVIRHYNNKGVELSKNGDLHGAIREYERALQFYPQFKENYRIYYNIALAQIKLKEPESIQKAIENLKLCLDLMPDFDKAHKTLEALEKHQPRA